VTALEADFTTAVATLVKTAANLRDADAGFRVELAQIAVQVATERGITRDMVDAVHARLDTTNALLERLTVAVERLAKRG
jgi:hypothetical protein